MKTKYWECPVCKKKYDSTCKPLSGHKVVYCVDCGSACKLKTKIKKYWVKLVCIKCKKVLNHRYYKLSIKNKISHGYCEDCAQKILIKYRKRKQS